jgi:hypothetical protein
MPPCRECGVVLDMPLKWFVGPGSTGRICSTCHSHESQWPINVTTRTVRESPHFQRALAGGNDELSSAAVNPNCGHWCKRIASPYNFCCVCGRPSSGGCSLCAPKMVASSLRGNGLPADQAEQIQQEIILKGVDGSSVRVSSSISRERESRLRRGHVKGYHQTCEFWSHYIDSAHMFKPGSDGLAGGGIYMAVCESDTHHKAHHYGVLYSCDVLLGNTKVISAAGDKSITFATLLAQGYDSVRIPRPGGDEYVVYNSDQVTNVTKSTSFVPVKSHCMDPHRAPTVGSQSPALPRCDKHCGRRVRFGRNPVSGKFWKTCCEPCARGRGTHDASCLK